MPSHIYHPTDAGAVPELQGGKLTAEEKLATLQAWAGAWLVEAKIEVTELAERRRFVYSPNREAGWRDVTEERIAQLDAQIAALLRIRDAVDHRDAGAEADHGDVQPVGGAR